MRKLCPGCTSREEQVEKLKNDFQGDQTRLTLRIDLHNEEMGRLGGEACWRTQQAYSAAANLEKPLPLNFLGTALRQKVTAGAPPSQKDVNQVAATYFEKMAEHTSKPRSHFNPAQLSRLQQISTMPPGEVRCQ